MAMKRACRTCGAELGEDETTWCHACWWAELGDDGQDAALASANTGSSTDFSYLDPEEDA